MHAVLSGRTWARTVTDFSEMSARARIQHQLDWSAANRPTWEMVSLRIADVRDVLNPPPVVIHEVAMARYRDANGRYVDVVSVSADPLRRNAVQYRNIVTNRLGSMPVASFLKRFSR